MVVFFLFRHHNSSCLVFDTHTAYSIITHDKTQHSVLTVNTFSSDWMAIPGGTILNYFYFRI